MKVSTELCAQIELQLVDGQRAMDDPALAAHIRSCLRCFRSATELREVPHIAALLRELDQPDPGELFWAKFPGSVADAWERRQAAPTARPRSPSWQSIVRWFQLPLPAALSGAALSAVLVLAVVNRSPPPEAVLRTPAPPVAATAGAAAAVTEITDDDEAGGVLGEDDPLEALELADVKAVVANMELESSGQGDDGFEPGPSPVEEMELLEADDLRAVAQALRARTEI